MGAFLASLTDITDVWPFAFRTVAVRLDSHGSGARPGLHSHTVFEGAFEAPPLDDAAPEVAGPMKAAPARTDPTTTTRAQNALGCATFPPRPHVGKSGCDQAPYS